MKYWYWFCRMMIAGVLIAGCDSGDGDEEYDGLLEIKLQRSIVSAYDVAQFADVTCEGDWQLDLSYPEEEKDWCSVSSHNGHGNAKVAVNYGKNEGKKSRTVTLRATAGGKSVETVLTQKGVDESDPDEGKSWMELPGIAQGSNYRFVTHETTVGGKKVRNYSMLFDTKERIAYWVAYPLCSMYLGRVGRTEAWQTDPNIPASQQMNASVRGYDRGHQIPSGDRTAARGMNEQTFYYSNMTPQLGKFNQEIWAKLEEKVRSWAKICDTLYVVTGTVLKTVGGNETVRYVTDGSGKKIAVPNYYYKVLLSLTMEGGTRKYKATGFWFEHKANMGSVNASYMMSVDEIERKTGWDFFKHLPTDVEMEVEKQLVPGDWGLRN